MLKGKNVVVTGSRRGIGHASVEILARNGANIWACARAYDDDMEYEMAGISQKYSVNIWPLYFDIKKKKKTKEAVKKISDQNIRVDALINSAGIIGDSSSFFMTSQEKMKKVFEVNFFATTVLTQYISRIMAKQNGGSIINISSIAGLDGVPAQYEYASCKAAMIGATKKLAWELSEYNIRVNAIAPGIIDTDMGNRIEDDLRKDVLSRVIMKRSGTPEEVANVAAFLASDLSGYVTGQVIRVDGGM